MAGRCDVSLAVPQVEDALSRRCGRMNGIIEVGDACPEVAFESIWMRMTYFPALNGSLPRHRLKRVFRPRFPASNRTRIIDRRRIGIVIGLDFDVKISALRLATCAWRVSVRDGDVDLNRATRPLVEPT